MPDPIDPNKARSTDTASVDSPPEADAAVVSGEGVNPPSTTAYNEQQQPDKRLAQVGAGKSLAAATDPRFVGDSNPADLEEEFVSFLKALPTKEELTDLSPSEFYSLFFHATLSRPRDFKRSPFQPGLPKYLFNDSSKHKSFLRRFSDAYNGSLDIPVEGHGVEPALYGIYRKWVFSSSAVRAFLDRFPRMLGRFNLLPKDGRKKALTILTELALSTDHVYFYSFFSGEYLKAYTLNDGFSENERNQLIHALIEVHPETEDPIKLARKVTLLGEIATRIPEHQLHQVVLFILKALLILERKRENSSDFSLRSEAIRAMATECLYSFRLDTFLSQLKEPLQRKIFGTLKRFGEELLILKVNSANTFNTLFIPAVETLPDDLKAHLAQFFLDLILRKGAEALEDVYVGVKSIYDLIRYVPEKKRLAFIRRDLEQKSREVGEKYEVNPVFHSADDLIDLLSFLGQKAQRKLVLDYFESRGKAYSTLTQHWCQHLETEKLVREDMGKLESAEGWEEIFQAYLWPVGFLEMHQLVSFLHHPHFLDTHFIRSLSDTALFKIIPEEHLGTIRSALEQAAKEGFGSVSRDALRGILPFLVSTLVETLWQHLRTEAGSITQFPLPAYAEKSFNQLMHPYVLQINGTQSLEQFGRVLSSFYSFPANLREIFANQILQKSVFPSLDELPEHLSRFLRERLVDVLDLTLAETSLLAASFEKHRAAWMQGDVLPNLIAAAHYVKEVARPLVKKLFLGLAASEVVGDDFIFEKGRFDSLEGLVSPEALSVWKKEKILLLTEKGSEKRTKPQDRKAIYQNTLSQLVDHLHLKDVDLKQSSVVRSFLEERFGREISAHAQEVRAILEKTSELIHALQEGRFVSLYQLSQIMGLFGRLGPSSFAGLPAALQDVATIIRVFHETLITEPLSGQQESVRLTHKVPHLLNKGSVPVLSCQRIYERTGQNAEGQPVAMVLLGQFKLSQYLFDDKVVARSVLELVSQPDGLHLTAERLHPGAGFTQEHVLRFEAAILDYAKELGIPEERVHIVFTKRNMTHAPKVQDHGLPIYRDTFERDSVQRLPLMEVTPSEGRILGPERAHLRRSRERASVIHGRVHWFKRSQTIQHLANKRPRSTIPSAFPLFSRHGFHNSLLNTGGSRPLHTFSSAPFPSLTTGLRTYMVAR